jgi:hypothetical protein
MDKRRKLEVEREEIVDMDPIHDKPLPSAKSDVRAASHVLLEIMLPEFLSAGGGSKQQAIST